MASDSKDASSCINDPNFAIICAFLQKFATKLNVEYPNFLDLQKMIENTDEGRSAVYAFLALLPYSERMSRAPHTLVHKPRTVSVHFVFVVGLARSAPHTLTHTRVVYVYNTLVKVHVY